MSLLKDRHAVVGRVFHESLVSKEHAALSMQACYNQGLVTFPGAFVDHDVRNFAESFQNTVQCLSQAPLAQIS